MGDYERNKGCLIKTTEDFILEKYPNAGFEDLEYTTEDTFVKIGKEYFVIDWEVKGDTSYPEFVDITRVEDLVHFHTYHYNGEVHWTELLEEYFSNEE